MDNRPNIAWLPHEAGHDDDGTPYYMDGCMFTTFGRGSHSGNDDLVYVDGITGPDDGHNPWGLDPKIADLIIALNRAGIETVQSCQSATPDDDVYDDVAPMGIVLVKLADFPKIAATLPTGVPDDDGWLAVIPWDDPEYVSVIFPLRDHDAWLAKLGS
jgi:hypothetical protein